MRSTSLLALAASLSSVQAAFQGFNYGATKSDETTPRLQADFEALFSQAKNLVGTNGGFTSARLYTTIQAGTANFPSSAIPAAIAQDTSLLLGLWASSGQDTITNEIAALKSAITQYGSAFTSRVAGISVGSEDLYRISPTGIENHSLPGADPATIADYIKQVKAALQGTALSGAAIGHVDTWTAWVNNTNQAVIDASDWIGMDAYPYFENTVSNGIQSGPGLLDTALRNTEAAVGGKPVWITETGWPISGDASNLAVASTANAKTFWDQAGCPRFGVSNVWWFQLQSNDASAAPNPDFSVANAGSTTPFYDLSCSAVSSSSSSASASATSSGASSASSASSASASSASSASVSSATASGVATSGGLTPTQGNGIGASAASSAPAASTPSGGASTGSGSGNSTSLSTSAKPTATGTAPATSVVSNAGNIISGSFAAMGVLFAGMLAL